MCKNLSIDSKAICNREVCNDKYSYWWNYLSTQNNRLRATSTRNQMYEWNLSSIFQLRIRLRFSLNSNSNIICSFSSSLFSKVDDINVFSNAISKLRNSSFSKIACAKDYFWCFETFALSFLSWFSIVRMFSSCYFVRIKLCQCLRCHLNSLFLKS